MSEGFNATQREIEILEARKEIARLKDIIRSCVHGPEVVDIGGESIGLHRPNKHCMTNSPAVGKGEA